MSKTLFGEKDFSNIKTQGIKYAGSKLKIIPYILEIIKEKEKEMRNVAKNLDFELAAILRDEIKELIKESKK